MAVTDLPPTHGGSAAPPQLQPRGCHRGVQLFPPAPYKPIQNRDSACLSEIFSLQLYFVTGLCSKTTLVAHCG